MRAPANDDNASAKAPYELRQARRQLEQISDAAAEFSHQLDLAQLYHQIAAHAARILLADVAVFYSYADRQLEVQATNSTRAKTNASTSFSSPSEDAIQCAKTLQPIVRNRTALPSVRNAMCVPLVGTQNRVVGVLEVRNKKNGSLFTAADERLGACLARIACTAVERAGMIQRLGEWQTSIESMLTFNATVNQNLPPEKMVQQLVANVTAFLNAVGGVAGIVVQMDSEPRVVSDQIYYNSQVHEFRREWNVGQGLPGTVVQTQFPVLIQDYAHSEWADPAVMERFEVGPCICVPIKNAREEVLGFFKLFRRRGEVEFTWQDAAFLESLGNTAAVAMENTRLVRSLEIKNEQIKNLSHAHLRRLEEERRHISRELHDQTGQVLVGLKLKLQLLAGLLTEKDTELGKELAGLQAQLNSAAAKLKDLAKQLRPPTLDELGFEASLRQLLAEFRGQVSFAINVDFRCLPELCSESETALYRIAQECLTNIAKHADATTANLVFDRVDGQQTFTIRDDGRGFIPHGDTSGLGLIGIKERVKMLGGAVRITSTPGQGTEVKIVLPEP